MAILSISTAAKAAGISRQSMYNHIKDGTISVTMDNFDKKGIDLSEILRVFGEIKNNPHAQGATLGMGESPQPDQSALIESLRDQIANLKDQLQKTEAREAAAVSRAAAAESKADDYLLRLLPAAAAPAPKKGLLARLFGHEN